MVVVPGMISGPVSVSAPPAVTVRSPPALDTCASVKAVRSSAVVSVIVTFFRFPEGVEKVTVPAKVLLLSSRTCWPAAAVKVALPVISNTPLSVISPPAVAVTA